MNVEKELIEIFNDPIFELKTVKEKEIKNNRLETFTVKIELWAYDSIYTVSLYANNDKVTLLETKDLSEAESLYNMIR